ncbi:MAG TPA: PEP/pyruvate-binding domain-containing protein, partial [Thermopolyspora sp.]
MNGDESVIGWLTDPKVSDPAFSGGKGASLATLARAGLPVPDGFVVSTDAYRRFVREQALAPLIARLTGGLAGDPDAAEAASARLRRAFAKAPVPAWLREQLAIPYAMLGRPATGPVAVRSSATAEDLPQASFAGQQESVLNVAGLADLCDAVRLCWSSLWTARALSYRQEHEIGHDRVAMAVVVQRMVPAEVAGVLFTADPLSGRRDHTVIEAAAGLGEAMVSGEVTPGRWVIDSATHVVLAAPPGSGDACGRPLLPSDRRDALVRLGVRAAALFGCPQDVEWAAVGRDVWLLQSRPITTLFPLPRPSPEGGLRVYLPVVYVGQGIAEPLTPAGTAFFRALAARWIRYWTTEPDREDGRHVRSWLPVVAGRLFGDVTPIVGCPRPAAWLVSSLRLKDPAASAA